MWRFKQGKKIIMKYEKLKTLCEKEGCRCPPKHDVVLGIANTLEWKRVFFANGGERLE